MITLVSIVFITAQAQLKQLLQHDSYKNWEEIGEYVISNDGNFIFYNYSTEISGGQLVVQSLDGHFKRQFPNARGLFFAPDSKTCIFRQADSAYFLTLASDEVQKIPKVRNIYTTKTGGGRWVVLQQDTLLIVLDLFNRQNRQVINGKYAGFNYDGTLLFIKKPQSLIMLSLPNNKAKAIFPGEIKGGVISHRNSNQFAFIAGNDKVDSVFYFNINLKTPFPMASSSFLKKHDDASIYNSYVEFNADGKQLYFYVIQNDANIPVKGDIPPMTNRLNVWNFKDQFLQSQQENNSNAAKYSAIVNVKTGSVLQLEDDNWSIVSDKGNNNCALLKSIVNEDEAYWNAPNGIQYSLFNPSLFEIKPVLRNLKNVMYPQISSSDKFLIWYDNEQDNYFTYNIKEGTVVNISKNINDPLFRIFNGKKGPVGIAGWLSDDQSILIYSEFDIWKVDPKGVNKPINLTKALGKKTRNIFRFCTGDRQLSSFRSTDSILLTAFNIDTKQNGFWKTTLAASHLPTQNSDMVDGLYYFPAELSVGFTCQQPIKAKEKDIYILTHQDPTSAPNIVVTTNFNDFTYLTSFKPQKDYNWMTKELLTWKLSDGEQFQGILYKPENFDSTKKYPVIFNYYDIMSADLNLYQAPSLSTIGFDIPWYVSNGYLIFLPDIHFTGGKPGADVSKSLISAANRIIELPYINKYKIGLFGHSWGGYSTNYIITQTNLFSAACAFSGISDFISQYGDIAFGGKSLTSMVEVGQEDFRMTPQESPDTFIKNSPIFHVSKIETPVLLMHGKKDEAVPFLQSLEMFNVLRRNKKPSWLLEYDDEYHTLDNENDKLDLTIRTQQFFDHFLKDKPAPVWMVQGIDRKYKGIRSGLALDDNGKCSATCRVCNKTQFTTNR